MALRVLALLIVFVATLKIIERHSTGVYYLTSITRHGPS
jgi:hypothetical protein